MFNTLIAAFSNIVDKRAVLEEIDAITNAINANEHETTTEPLLQEMSLDGNEGCCADVSIHHEEAHVREYS